MLRLARTVRQGHTTPCPVPRPVQCVSHVHQDQLRRACAQGCARSATRGTTRTTQGRDNVRNARAGRSATRLAPAVCLHASCVHRGRSRAACTHGRASRARPGRIRTGLGRAGASRVRPVPSVRKSGSPPSSSVRRVRQARTAVRAHGVVRSALWVPSRMGLGLKAASHVRLGQQATRPGQRSALHAWHASPVHSLARVQQHAVTVVLASIRTVLAHRNAGFAQRGRSATRSGCAPSLAAAIARPAHAATRALPDAGYVARASIKTSPARAVARNAPLVHSAICSG